jgi:hypothetical protein
MHIVEYLDRSKDLESYGMEIIDLSGHSDLGYDHFMTKNTEPFLWLLKESKTFKIQQFPRPFDFLKPRIPWWTIAFEDPDEALLFKLKWGGQ